MTYHLILGAFGSHIDVRSWQMDMTYEVLLFALALVFGIWHHVQPRPIAWLRSLDGWLVMITVVLVCGSVLRDATHPVHDTPVITGGVLLLASMLVELVREWIVRWLDSPPVLRLPRARVISGGRSRSGA
jgi:hypothetical protein